MHHSPIVLLVEASIKPAHVDEVVKAARAALADTLREPGCLAFFQSARAEAPNQLVFFEVFASEADHQRHLERDYTRRVFAAMEGKLEAPPRVTHLRQLDHVTGTP